MTTEMRRALGSLVCNNMVWLDAWVEHAEPTMLAPKGKSGLGVEVVGRGCHAA